MKHSQKNLRRLFIKNMVCNRCIKVVREDLEKLGLSVSIITLGEVELSEEIDIGMLNKISIALKADGFELIEDKKVKIIEKIKSQIIEIIYNKDMVLSGNVNFSDYIQKKIGLEYHYLSKLFSSTEGITIEQYFIFQKVERAKELLKYGELTLSEIAYKLGYSSVQHLSNQFKKVTGLSATDFKNMTENMRKPLDSVASNN